MFQCNLINLILLNLLIYGVSALVKSQENPILQSLSKHEVVTLHQFHDYHHSRKLSRPSTQLHQRPGLHIPDSHFSIFFDGKTYDLDLHINKELLPNNFMTTTYSDTDDFVTSKPTPEETNHCYYHGHVRNIENSQVIASTCHGLQGCIILPDDFLIIEPLHSNINPLHSNNSNFHDHVIYRPRDYKQASTGTCGNKDESTQIENFMNQLTLYSNSMNTTSQSRQKRQATTERKFVELLVVVDSLEAKKFPDRKNLENRVKELANYMDGFYQKLGIRIVLSHIEVWSNSDRTTLSSDAQQTLDSFTEYRKERIATESSSSPWVYADNVHLLYGGDFIGSTIGMASVGTMCSPQSVGVNQDHSSKVINTAATVAHEMGHNFGMLHDSQGCSCPDSSQCIMAASSGYADSRDWSSCSRGYLDQNLQQGLKSCLLNVPEPSRIYGGPHCGNEIVEEGEECDCGEPGYCSSSCCDPQTCRLLPEAECDAGLCCSGCSLLSSGTPCREVNGNQCELPEYCTGTSPYCPADYYKEDGTLCLQGTATCYEGICLTHTMQCQNIWGPSATNGDDLCYTFINNAGNQNGNCGKDDRGRFIPCSDRNALCGKLHCEGGSKRPIIGSSRSTYTNEITSGSKRVQCRTVGSVAENSDILDPGLVRSGTRCADGKVCLEGVCQNIPNLTCSLKCNGNGVCNNRGHCHCDSGWAPPFCTEQGTGGSVDSSPGPSETSVVIIIVIILAVLVLLTAIGLLAWCKYFRGRPFPKWKRGRDTEVNSNPKLGRSTYANVDPSSTSRQNLFDSSSRSSPNDHRDPSNRPDHTYDAVSSYPVRSAPPPPTAVGVTSKSHPPRKPLTQPPYKPSVNPPPKPVTQPPPNPAHYNKPSNSPSSKPPSVPPTKPANHYSPVPKPQLHTGHVSMPPPPPSVPLNKPVVTPVVLPAKPISSSVAVSKKPSPPLNKPVTAKPSPPPIVSTKPKPLLPPSKPQSKPVVPANKPSAGQNQFSKPNLRNQPSPSQSSQNFASMSVAERARKLNQV